MLAYFQKQGKGRRLKLPWALVSFPHHTKVHPGPYQAPAPAPLAMVLLPTRTKAAIAIVHFVGMEPGEAGAYGGGRWEAV